MVMADKKINTVLIEDSGLMRIMLTDIIRNQPDLNLLSTAKNGAEGVEKVKKFRPDVVITDMVMPDMGGLDVVKAIMNELPTPILILSALEKSNPAVFDALDAGAFDFIDKPQFKTSLHHQELGNTLTAMAKEALLSKEKLSSSAATKENFNQHTFDSSLNYDIIGIGSSTGGPKALESIIKMLPCNLPVPVVIAQHMSNNFITSFSQRLNQLTPLEIKIPHSGETLERGKVYIAPGDKNMRVIRKLNTNEAIARFTNKTYEAFNFPSVDCLFESLAETYQSRSLGVVLTGMGKDGTIGLEAIKKHGGYAIAQDEKSSLVFGMPKSAIDAGLVDKVVSLNEIPWFLVNCL